MALIVCFTDVWRMTESWKWNYGLLDPISSISKWEHCDVKMGDMSKLTYLPRSHLGFLIPIPILIFSSVNLPLPAFRSG